MTSGNAQAVRNHWTWARWRSLSFRVASLGQCKHYTLGIVGFPSLLQTGWSMRRLVGEKA